MHWYYYLAYFFGGAFLANSLPHLVNGISGRAFQSPFASPPGKGLSSSTVNVLWGFFNLLVAWLPFPRRHLQSARHTARARLRRRHAAHVRHVGPRISGRFTGAGESSSPAIAFLSRMPASASSLPALLFVAMPSRAQTPIGSSTPIRMTSRPLRKD